MRAPVLSLKASVFDVTLKLDHSLIADLPVFGGLAPEALDEILARRTCPPLRQGRAGVLPK